MHFDGPNAHPRVAVVTFASPQAAERIIAGVPAVARAVREAALAGMETCIVAVGSEWLPSGKVAREIDRLAGTMRVLFVDDDAAWLTVSIPATTSIVGEELFGDDHLAERRIMLATAKPGDGLVSRTINRPISRRISTLMLRLDWIRPIHATAMTAATAAAMFAALIAGGESGLVIGAFLFQAASILDGVDGEIARATFRTSRFGAAMDSLIDAVTNVAFIGGVIANLWTAGHSQVAQIGAVGLIAMALGLLVLGLNAQRSNGHFNFDLVKNQFGKRPSRLKKWLTWLTMRDSYALGALAFVVSGHAGAGLVSFAVVAVGWLSVVCALLGAKSPAFCRQQGDPRPTSSEVGQRQA